MRRKPKKTYYMKRLNPLWIFKVHSAAGRRAYLLAGDLEITQEEYDSYEKKGEQEGQESVVPPPRRKRLRSKSV